MAVNRCLLGLALATLLALGGAAHSEEGVLVAHVSVIGGSSIEGVFLGTRGVGSMERTDRNGKVRIRLAAGTQSGDWVSLQLRDSEQEWVFISPLDGRVQVPSFDNATESFAPVILGRRGDRLLLENGSSLKALAANIVEELGAIEHETGITEAQRQAVLEEQAEAFGLKPGEVDHAIRAWQTRDSFEKSLVAIYAGVEAISVKLERIISQYESVSNVRKLATLAAVTKAEEPRLEELRNEYDLGYALLYLDQESWYYVPRGIFWDVEWHTTEVIQISDDYVSILLPTISNQEVNSRFEGNIAQVARNPGKQSFFDFGFLQVKAEYLSTVEGVPTVVIGLKEIEFPPLVITLNNQALVHYTQGRYAKAAALFEHSLEILELWLEPEDPAFATTLNGLASVYGAQRRYAAAELLLQRSLEIQEKALGPEHLSLAKSLNNLAWLYEAWGRYAAAEPMYQRSLQIKEKALGLEHPSIAITLNNLGVFYTHQGRYDVAENQLLRALQIKEKMLGQEDPSLATTLNSMADLYYHQGRYEDAVPLHQRDLAICEAALPPDHPAIVITLQNYSNTLRKLADEFEARARAIRAKRAEEDRDD